MCLHLFFFPLFFPSLHFLLLLLLFDNNFPGVCVCVFCVR